MKKRFILPLSGLVALGLASCTQNDEAAVDEYGAPIAGTADANQYGVPQAPAYEPVPTPPPAPQPTYQPSYQPAPSYPPIPSAPPAYPSQTNQAYPPVQQPAFNDTPAFPSPSGPRTVSHQVVKGDTLWALSRRYNTTVGDIKAANGLSGDTIRTGSTLQIPQ